MKVRIGNVCFVFNDRGELTVFFEEDECRYFQPHVFSRFEQEAGELRIVFEEVPKCKPSA